MNRYHDAMEHCAPPPELEERLREAVSSVEPEPHPHPTVYRPRGFCRKALLAAILAVVLTLSVGAAVLSGGVGVGSACDACDSSGAGVGLGSCGVIVGFGVLSICETLSSVETPPAVNSDVPADIPAISSTTIQAAPATS